MVLSQNFLKVRGELNLFHYKKLFQIIFLAQFINSETV